MVCSAAGASPIRSDARGSPADAAVSAPVGRPRRSAGERRDRRRHRDRQPALLGGDRHARGDHCARRPRVRRPTRRASGTRSPPPTTAWVTADTFGSDYDTTLAVYAGSPGALSELACNDDSGRRAVPRQLPRRGRRHLLPARGRLGRRRQPRPLRRRRRAFREAPGQGHRSVRGHAGGRARMAVLGPGSPRRPLLGADGAGARGSLQGQPLGDARLLRRVRRRRRSSTRRSAGASRAYRSTTSCWEPGMPRRRA